MLRIMAISNVRAQAVLRNVGLMQYIEADEDSKETIKKAEKEGRIVLEGIQDDDDRSILVGSIVDLIDTESLTEKIRTEVEMLSAIQRCK